jgi:ABC-type maltose transport system permease subunit
MLTIDVKTLLLCLLLIAVIVLIIFAIVAVYNLIKTLKSSQKVLADFEVVSEVASKRTKQLDEAIEKSSKKIKNSGGVASGITSAIPIIISAVAAIAKYGANKKDESSKKK